MIFRHQTDKSQEQAYLSELKILVLEGKADSQRVVDFFIKWCVKYYI